MTSCKMEIGADDGIGLKDEDVSVRVKISFGKFLKCCQAENFFFGKVMWPGNSSESEITITISACNPEGLL